VDRPRIFTRTLLHTIRTLASIIFGTITHTCWNCPAASNVWGSCSIKLQKIKIGAQDFLQIFKEVLTRCDKAEVELFAVVARRIWLQRNEVVHGGQFLHPTKLLSEAGASLADF
jgi:hypothetical protein